MKKCFTLVAVLLFTCIGSMRAQLTFTAPDTVCINQPITLKSLVTNANNYFWGFCSGDLNNAPTGINMGQTFGFHLPGNIDIVQDFDGNYYGFVVNTETDEFLRLNYGKSLVNTPTVTNFGDLTAGLPHHPTSLFILYDTVQARWFVFVSGGITASESTLGRIDFYGSLGNPHPNVVNFGNLYGLLDGPKGIFVAKDANTQWYGYLVNRNNNQLIKLDFIFNISNTPTPTSLGNPGGVLNQPTDMAGVYDNGGWYLFATNRASNSLIRFELGTSINTLTPLGADLGNFNSRILVPSSLTINRDCGNLFIYITDSSTSQLIEIKMGSAAGTYTGVDYSVLGGMNFPSGISSILRDHDNLYCFVTNTKDSSLTRLTIGECANATIPSYSEMQPPTYSYNAPGTYNVYFVTNQGLPTQTVECKEIHVLAVPNIYMNNDTTICQGDTIHIYAVSNTADSFFWYPGYNIDTVYNYVDSVRIWPAHDESYRVLIKYPFGCIIDTAIKVHVSRVAADAGPDRTIVDGSVTTLGGPNTSLNGPYLYQWLPYQYINDTSIPFPVASPHYDMSYMLQVTELNDELGCKARDTVNIHVVCGEIVLPNAFSPGSPYSGVNTFGILNHQVPRLNYFRIYNRWGIEVFETTDPGQAWDGTFNNQPAPEGVYVWEADGFCSDGKPVRKVGNVTLLR